MATATKNNSHSYIPRPPSNVPNMRYKNRSKEKSREETVSSTGSNSKGHFSQTNSNDEEWVCFTDGSNSQEMMLPADEFSANNEFSFKEGSLFHTETFAAVTASAPPFEATLDSHDAFQNITNFDKIDIVADDIIEVNKQEIPHQKKPLSRNRPRPPRPGNADANKNCIGSSTSFNSSGSDSSGNRRKTGSNPSTSSQSSRISNNVREPSLDERTETLSSRSSRHSSMSRGEPTERRQMSSSSRAPTERRQSCSSRGATEERRTRSSSRGVPTESRHRSSSRGAGVERRQRSSSRGAGVERRQRSSSRGAGVERRQRSSSRGAGVERRTRSSSRGAGVERRTRSSSRGAGVERRTRSSSRGIPTQKRSKSATRVGLGRDRSKSQTTGDLSVIGSSSLASSSQRQSRSGTSPKERGRSLPVQKRSRSKSRGRFFSPTRSAVDFSPQRTDSELSKSTQASSSIGPGLFLRKRSSSIRSGTGSMSMSSNIPPIPNRNTSSVLSASACSILNDSSINESCDPSEQPSERSESNSKESGSLRVKLFGDQVSKSAKRAYLPFETTSRSNSFSQKNPASPSPTSSHATISLPKAVHTRQLLKSSVCHNNATGLWISTVNTNQKSSVIDAKQNSKYLKAFSFLTEREAKESSYANAPPIMLPFSENRHCFICQGKFAIFRRASHCRNCGVCICNSCSVSWNKAMIPDTYNIKKENYVKVCKSCDFLSRSFRHALLQGHYDNAVTLYNSGNINLRCPFMNVKGSETMFPIHCAAQGGNLVLVRWLVDVHYCPIKMLRTGNKNKGTTDELLATSKGRNILDFVMEGKHVDMLRYLVREKGVSVHEIKDLKTSLNALEAILSSNNDDDFITDSEDDEDNSSFDEEDEVDEEEKEEKEDKEDRRVKFKRQSNENHVPNFTIDMYDDSGEDAPNVESTEESDEESVATTVADACIICYENTIDCVITPCGHQICCLQCSENLKTCPVCNIKCNFIRIYKP